MNVILIVAVVSGWILISVDAGLSGFERFWTLLDVLFWVVVVGSCWILISVEAGLSDFDRFLDVIFVS